jgi:NADPH:quinone reductase-like Zn-dependent oxidoreductase
VAGGGRRIRRPIVDRVFPLAEAAAAHAHVASSQHVGKVLLAV